MRLMSLRTCRSPKCLLTFSSTTRGLPPGTGGSMPLSVMGQKITASMLRDHEFWRYRSGHGSHFPGNGHPGSSVFYMLLIFTASFPCAGIVRPGGAGSGEGAGREQVPSGDAYPW